MRKQRNPKNPKGEINNDRGSTSLGSSKSTKRMRTSLPVHVDFFIYPESSSAETTPFEKARLLQSSRFSEIQCGQKEKMIISLRKMMGKNSEADNTAMGDINCRFRSVCRLRGYAVAAERVTGQAVKRAAVESPAAGEKTAAEKEAAVFWMRDPKSGNWLPETHFDDVDAADLRKQLLPSNRKKAF
nr:protein SENESCENCE-ASSOCIATED GENE 21, mitochondrial-like [Ipomoea batatas]